MGDFKHTYLKTALFAGVLIALNTTLIATPVNATTINFTGTLGVIEVDNGSSRYSGLAVGDMFSGSITYGNSADDGIVSNPTSTGTDYIFTGSPYGGFVTVGSITTEGTNSEVLIGNNESTDEAAPFINNLYGSGSTISATADTWIVESGNTTTTFFGLALFQNIDAYSNTDFQPFPPEIDESNFALFFVAEDEAGTDTGIYFATGILTSITVDSVPLVSEVILFGTSTGFGSGGGQGTPGSGSGGGATSEFHRVDINTGVATEISMEIGFGGDVGGLAANSNNVLFAGTGGRGPNDLGRGESPTLLFTINPINGLANPEIGPLGIEFGPPDSAELGPGAGDFDQFGSLRQNISGWSFDPISGALYGMAARGSQLFTADTTTGLATRVGTPCPLDIDGNATRCGRGNAIAFDDVGVNTLGKLYWANEVEIAELDPADGSIIGIPVLLDFSPFGPPANEAGFRVVAMDYHPLTGELYAAVQQGEPDISPPARSTLAILDPLLGTFTIIGATNSTGVKLDGIAFTHQDTIGVNIDIKPGGDPNAVNPRSMGIIPVAILTSDAFDATTVDPSTVQFGPGGAGIGHGSVNFEDVDVDGDLDLLLHFPTQETTITCGDSGASLFGATFDGTLISGSDSIVTIGCN